MQSGLNTRWRLVLLAWGGMVAGACGENLFFPFDGGLPPPNRMRSASGAPGPDYWQQQVDYAITVKLDPEADRLNGEAVITYKNRSPDTLAYLWLQLDQELFRPESASHRIQQTGDLTPEAGREAPQVAADDLRGWLHREDFPGGYTLTKVESMGGQALTARRQETNLRVDLPQPLGPGETFAFRIGWECRLTTYDVPLRHGVERLEKDGAPVFHVAQWYPRLCAYTDYEGWQLRPYLDWGEFTLEFGRFDVRIQVPDTYVVAATGELQNPGEVLTAAERERLGRALGSFAEPVMLVTQEEAAARRAAPAEGWKTWHFAAEPVRDFAFGASPAYLVDAQAVKIGNRAVLAMSAYPEEAAGIWERYSTAAVKAALEGYSERVLPYPYPVAWSVWGPETGMEYPMVSFQEGKVEEDGTYSLGTRNYVIGVIIHEVGHNWFPMIINSDERNWMWMDEGLNSFMDRMVSASFDARVRDGYRSSQADLVEWVAGEGDQAAHLLADSITNHYTSYEKIEVGLMMLRNAVLGPEAFDAALREYARRWAFKRPTPADFFRTMEDASGSRLEWFWRGWFFGDQAVDLAVTDVTSWRMTPQEPEAAAEMKRTEEAAMETAPWERSLADRPATTEAEERLRDFYVGQDLFAVTPGQKETYADWLKEAKPWQKKLAGYDGRVHVVRVENLGGLPMPMMLDLTFADGTQRRVRVPVEIWQTADEVVHLPIPDRRELVRVELDRDHATADANRRNNAFPQEIAVRRFEVDWPEKPDNLMRELQAPEQPEEKEAAPEGDHQP